MTAIRKGTDSLPVRLNNLGYRSYRDYLKSEHWADLRKRYWKSKLVTRNEEGRITCAYCNSTGLLNLHHKTYKRLGGEKLHDLILLCSLHHEAAHEAEKAGNQLWKATKLAKRLHLRYCSYCDANTTDLPKYPNCGHQMK